MTGQSTADLESGHERLDSRSLAMHRAIVEKLRRSPELIEVAKEHLRRWSLSAGLAQPYLTAWE